MSLLLPDSGLLFWMFVGIGGLFFERLCWRLEENDRAKPIKEILILPVIE